MRAAEAKRKRRRTLTVGAVAAVIVAAAVTVTAIALTRGGQGPTSTALSSLGTLKPAPSPGPKGPEGVPVPSAPALAGTTSAASGAAVDGIRCQSGEQSLFHIHAHLTIVVGGALRQVPAGIGIAGARTQNTAAGPFVSSGTCFYWLHTHAADGIIHIESPVRRVYTLGNLFDLWGQPLGPDVAGPAKGQVIAIENGKVFRGNPRDIPLSKHAQIQLEVGRPLVRPEQITFPGGL